MSRPSDDSTNIKLLVPWWLACTGTPDLLVSGYVWCQAGNGIGPEQAVPVLDGTILVFNGLCFLMFEGTLLWISSSDVNRTQQGSQPDELVG
jgi:hypothetical protein